jgi:hypothetical protein
MKVSGWLVTWAVCSFLGLQLIAAICWKLGGGFLEIAGNVVAFGAMICLIASIGLVVAYFLERRGGRGAS